MSAPRHLAQIPANCLQNTLDRSDFLIGDLKTMRGLLEKGEPISAALAYAIENAILGILDELSPEVRHAESKARHYAETPKLGEGLFQAGTGGRP